MAGMLPRRRRRNRSIIAPRAAVQIYARALRARFMRWRRDVVRLLEPALSDVAATVVRVDGDEEFFSGNSTKYRYHVWGPQGIHTNSYETAQKVLNRIRNKFPSMYRKMEQAGTARIAENPAFKTLGNIKADPVSLRARLQAAVVKLEGEFNEKSLLGLTEKVAQRVKNHNAREWKRVAGIQPRSDAGMGAVIDKFREQNVAKIRSIAGKQLTKITKLLESSEATGLRVEELRDRIIDDLGVAESKAELLARDQVLTLNAEITRTRMQNSGITRYVWTTSGDERVRGNPDGKWPNGGHYDLDGTEQRWDTPPIVDERTGRRAHPGEDFQCRCTATPILDFDEE